MLKPSDIKIIFMGTPDFAVPCLKELHTNDYNIVGVFTNPDKPAGRNSTPIQSPIKQFATKNSLPIFQPETLRSKQSIQELTNIQPDLIITAAYGQILPKRILDIPKKGPLNVHASLLPRHRGASPIHYALLEGDQETGITIMLMDKGMDTGPIISKEEIPIKQTDTLSSLHDRLSLLAAQLLIETLPQWLQNRIKPQVQDESLATHTKILKKEDGLIDWSHTSAKIVNRIRAFNPWPGTHTALNGKTLKVHQALIPSAPIKTKPGKFKILDQQLFVGTGDGSLAIKKIQLEGKKPITDSEFIRGYSHLLDN